MKESSPSIQEWENLYDTAIKFREIECWNWMYDSDMFGVQSPVDGEIGYCCVMGKLGEHFALATYLGTDGLEGYLKIQSGEISLSNNDMDILHIQKCLMASFEDRQYLQKPDLQVIKKLGLNFRGRNSWPLFRSYRPGYHPWYLTSDEAEYLTLTLQQTIEVALRFKDDPDMLTSPEENHYLVRVPKKEDEGWRWRDEWLEPPALQKIEVVSVPIDEVRLERIEKIASRRPAVWEVDFFYFPGGVGEKKERPYYPYVFLCMEHNSHLILNTDLAGPSDYRLKFPEQFLNFIEKVKVLPSEILVSKEEMFKLLAPASSRLSIKLRWVKRLAAMEEAKDSMFEFFPRGSDNSNEVVL